MKIQSISASKNSLNSRAAHVILVTMLMFSASNSTFALPVGDALNRPSAISRNASKAVLLGAEQVGSRIVAVGERGIILLSDDNGSTWRQATVPVSVTLVAIRFVDVKTGYAVGHGGTVLTTHDGGETWTSVLDGKRIAELSLEAVKDSGDVVAVRNAQRLIDEGADKPLLDVCILNSSSLLVVGAYGLALSSTDSGRTWQPLMAKLDNPKGLHLYSLRANANRLIIAGEQGLLLYSKDSGRTFQKLKSPYKGSFFTAELLKNGNIVVAGLRGNVWRSHDDGKSWKQAPLGIPVNITGSTTLADDNVVLADQSGTVSIMNDREIVPLKTPQQPPINNVLALSNGGLMTVGIQGAFVIPETATKLTGAKK
jgi:photosystem II stability/assembly factor-like uncharacterized protein